MSGLAAKSKFAALLAGTVAVSFCGGTQYNDRGTKLTDLAGSAKKSSNSTYTPEVYTNIPYVILSEIEQLAVILGNKFPDASQKAAWEAAKLKIGTVDVGVDLDMTTKRELYLKAASVAEGTHDAVIKLPGSSLTMSKAVMAVAERSDLVSGNIISGNTSLTSGSLAVVAQNLTVNGSIRNELYYPFSLSVSDSLSIASGGKIEGPVDFLAPLASVAIAGTIDLTLAGDPSGGSGSTYDTGETNLPHCEEGIAEEIAKITDRASFLKFLHSRVANGAISLMRVVGETVAISGKIIGHQNMANNCHSTPVLYLQADASITGSIDLHNGLVYVFGSLDEASKEKIFVGDEGLLMVEAK